MPRPSFRWLKAIGLCIRGSIPSRTFVPKSNWFLLGVAILCARLVTRATGNCSGPCWRFWLRLVVYSNCTMFAECYIPVARPVEYSFANWAPSYVGRLDCSTIRKNGVFCSFLLFVPNNSSKVKILIRRDCKPALCTRDHSSYYFALGTI